MIAKKTSATRPVIGRGGPGLDSLYTGICKQWTLLHLQLELLLMEFMTLMSGVIKPGFVEETGSRAVCL